ncbi:MAG: hypothetical protein ABJF01_19595 [bacterium]
MSAPSLDRDFHVLEFDSTTEAAAFVAALSRFLHSPVGSTYVGHPDSVQVWSHLSTRSAGRNSSVDVFLSPDALDAASAAFSPILVSGRLRGDELPAGCALVIGGEPTPARGLDEVEYMLIYGRS